MPLAPGATLGPYDIVAPIGSGGMGTVYRARDRRLQRDVAVKVLKADGPIDDTSRAGSSARRARSRHSTTLISARCTTSAWNRH